MEQFIDSIHSFCPCESVNRCLVLISLCSPVKQQTVQRWTQPWWLSSFPRWSSLRFPLTIKCKILAPPSSALMAFCSSSRRSGIQEKKRLSYRHRHYRTQSCYAEHHDTQLHTSWTPVTYGYSIHWHPITHSYPMHRNTVLRMAVSHTVTSCCTWLYRLL